MVAGGFLRCAKQERRGSGVSSVGKSRLFPAQLHPLCLGAWSCDSGGRRRTQCRVCTVSAPLLEDPEGTLESLIPEQAFWLSCVWAVRPKPPHGLSGRVAGSRCASFLV